jgi:hypothetical protein
MKVGNVTNDRELRFTPLSHEFGRTEGTPVANFTVASTPRVVLGVLGLVLPLVWPLLPREAVLPASPLRTHRHREKYSVRMELEGQISIDELLDDLCLRATRHPPFRGTCPIPNFSFRLWISSGTIPV